MKDSVYECGRAYDVFSLAAQLCILDDGQIFSCDLTPQGKSRKIFTKREPVGVISAITPFNHPLNMVSHKVAPAIATNNCVVCKPTELTPLTALALADILYEAGLPPEMFQVVTGWPDDIGDEMVTNPHIEVITFTGGVRVGKLIAAKAGYKRAALELGGNDPLIILNDLSDSDLDKAAELAVAGSTRNSGQRCTAVKRILVQNRIADKFVALVLEKAKKIKFGDPMDPDYRSGLRGARGSRQGVRSPGSQGRRARAPKSFTIRAARVRCCRPSRWISCRTQSELVFEETFGPIIPIVRVPDDDAEVIRISNSTPFGLSSGVCTNDLCADYPLHRGPQCGYG